MFEICSKYCLRRFRVGLNYFIKISNYTNLNIFFIVQYNTESGTITKQSSVFGKDKFAKVYFDPNATNMAFNVLQDTPTRDFICNKVLLAGKRFYYFNVVESPTGPICVQDIC